MPKFKDVDLYTGQITIKHYLGAHEILLSFNNANEALKFNDWWYLTGSEQFNEWVHGEDN